MKVILITGLFISFSIRLFSQELYIPLNIQKAIDKGTRTLNGSPGKNYWQNFADYDLKIKFNPKSLLVSGTEDISYMNNSPDTLHEMVIRLYPNYYKKGVMRDKPVEAKDLSDGVIIESMMINKSAIDVSDKSKEVEADETILIIQVKPIAPGQKSNLSISWHYTLNKGSHNRMGQVEPGSYFLAYSFPRIAVYDDVKHWDYSQYAGRNEPYFDFGNFNAEVTVPKNYVVWATGELQNTDEVFQPAVAAKYKSALASDKIINVIDSIEADADKVTAKNKWNTFKFKADFVLDFTFATSDHYIWQSCGITVDSSSHRRILVNSAFNKKTKDFFEVNNFSRKTIEVMSYDFPGVPYPYPHITVFQGLDQMEFPMIINDNPLEDRAESIELTDHEIFHSLFPFYMGTNQTRYAWMDEGWATIGEWYISPKIDTTLVDEYGHDRALAALGKEVDIPLIIPSYEINDAYFLNAYAKPAYILLYLKDMLGDDLFRKAIHEYMNTWHGKHPIPWDFFNSVNKGCGKNLDWFWKAWFYDYGSVDLAIDSVKNISDGHEITIRLKGTKPVPVYCMVTYADGTYTKIHETAAIWADGNKIFHIKTTDQKEVTLVTVHNLYVPDVDESDNMWKR